MELKNKKINFLGDSITEGVGTSAPACRFTELIAKNYGAVCRNYGISATRIARQQTVVSDVDRSDMDFCGRVASMDPDADILVIFGGTNDYGHGDAPIGTMSDRTVNTFYGALHVLYSSLIEKYPHALIVVLTPLHRCDEDNPSGENRKAADVGALSDYVHIIRQVAEYYALPVLDLFAASGLQPRVPTIKELYVPDGLHPNDNGHKILAVKIAHFLETL